MKTAHQQKLESRQNFSRALKELRLQRGWAQSDLARFLGVTTASVANWESQANGVTARNLKAMSDKLGLPIDYFRLGATALLAQAPPPAAGPHVRRVPVVSWARAGEAHDYADLCHQLDDAVETDCKDANAFALIIEGDSMEPEFMAGDIVVFTPNSEPRNGDIVVCRLKETHGVLLKRYRRTGPEGKTVRLESVNPNYQPLEFRAAEIAFVYPAVHLKRRIRR
jgi:SOS-response transcriptional repressor LexA